MSHRCTLSQQAGLLHASRSSKLLHVLTEVTLSALCPHTGLAAPAPRPPASCPPTSPPAQRLTARHPRTSQLDKKETKTVDQNLTFSLSILIKTDLAAFSCALVLSWATVHDTRHTMIQSVNQCKEFHMTKAIRNHSDKDKDRAKPKSSSQFSVSELLEDVEVKQKLCFSCQKRSTPDQLTSTLSQNY